MKIKNFKLKIISAAKWCWATLPRRIVCVLVITSIIMSSIWFLLLKPKPVEAGWFDQDWLYRRSIPITNNTTAETNRYVSVTIDTSDTTKFQADCGDLRFTKLDGSLMKYFISSGCATASTVIHVQFDTLQAGLQTIYYYYGNSSADNGFEGTDFSTVATNYTVGSIGSEEKGLGPVLWLKFDEGYGTLAYNSTPNDAGKLPGLQLDTAHPLANGLVGLWLMNEGTGTTVADLSGNGNIGIFGTTTAAPYWTSGKFGQGLGFAGIYDYINCGAFRYLETFTLEAWIKANTDVTIYRTIIDKGTGTGDRNFWLSLEQTTGVLGLRFSVAGVAKTFLANTALNDNVWHHVAAVYDKSYVKLYVDGILDITPGTQTGAPGNPVANCYIGYQVTNSTRVFFGIIDVVRIFNRALSASEIAQLYREPFAMVSDTGASKISGASWTGSGKFDKALDFDGTDDVVTVIRGDTNVGLQNKSAYSISTWIYPHSDGENNVGEIIDKGTNTYIRVDSEGEDGYLDLEAGLDLASGDPTLNIANAVQVNQWSHILLVWEDDSDDEFAIYVNGINMGTSSGGDGAPADDSGSDLLIGGDTNANFDGKIDEVKIYPYARSAAQVKRDYNQGFAVRLGGEYTLPSGLVGWWKMDEGSGSTAYDTSSATNDGTITGATWKGSADCKYGPCLSFNGSGNYVDVGNTSETGVKTVALWVKPDAVNVTEEPLDLNGTAYVKITNGTVSGEGFTSPTVYINGIIGSTVTTNWNFIAITTSAGISASDLDIGRLDTTYFDGKIDNVMIFNRALSAGEIADLYAIGQQDKKAVGYWKMDEGFGTTAYDASGRGNNLTLSAESYTMSGKFGRAWDGDGAKWLYQAVDNNDFDFAAADDFSITGWFKSDSATNPTSGVEYLVEKKASSTGYAIYFDTGGDVIFGVDDYADSTWEPDDTAGDVGRDFYDNSWHHFVGVKTGTTKIEVYVDGVKIETKTGLTSTGTLANSALLYIGDSDDTNNGDEFNGDIDEVKIYRFALSADDVKLEYNRAKALQLAGDRSQAETYCPPGFTGTCDPPVAEWKMDEYSGATAYDTSANANNGTITNATWKGSADCKYGSCLSFDGNGDYVTTNLKRNFGQKVTISVCVRFNTLAARGGIIGSRYWVDNEFSLEHHDAPGQIMMILGVAKYAYWTIPRVDTSSWFHLVIAVDTTQSSNADKVKMYSNGILVNQSGFAGITNEEVKATSFFVNIGTNSSSYFNGLIDLPMIFNRALTQEEVAWLYNKGKPVGQWKFDEGEGSTAKDSSVNNLSGTITEAAWTSSGKFNSALNFDGTNDVVTVTNNAAINMTSKTSYSVCGWINPDTDGEADAGRWFSKGNSYVRVDTESAGTVKVSALFDLEAAGSDASLTTTQTIPIGSWSHICTTWKNDDDDEITIYINGVNAGSSTNGSGAPATDSNNLLIGGSTGNNFDGKIDEVKIYNYELTTEQVKMDYNQGAAIRFGE